MPASYGRPMRNLHPGSILLTEDIREKKERGSSGETSTVTSVWLKVLNEKFNTVSQIRVTEDSETALHPTLQVIGNRILIAYGHRELPLSGSASRSNVWMRVFELACDERNERRAQSHESLDRR